MAANAAAAAEASGWPRDELAHLVQAWGEVVEPPRDRELLVPELLRMHSRFEELCGRRGGRWLGSMERQRLRLVAAYRFISARCGDERSSNSRQWFQTPKTLQEQATRSGADAITAATVMAIDEELFRAIERVFRHDPVATDAAVGVSVDTEGPATDAGGIVSLDPHAPASTRDTPAASTSEAPTVDTDVGAVESNADTGNDEATTHQQQIQATKPDEHTVGDRGNEFNAAEALAGLPIMRLSTTNPPAPSIPAHTPFKSAGRSMDAVDGANPQLRWMRYDDPQLIHVWDDTVRRLVEAKQPCFALDQLVLERFTDVCGPNRESTSSVCSRRLNILNAFKFLRAYLASRPSDAPQWFEMTVAGRLTELAANGYREEYACTLQAAELGSLSSIMENERRLRQLNREASGSTNGDSERRNNYPSRASSIGLGSGFDVAVSGRSRGPRTHRSSPRGVPTDLRSRYRSSPDIDGSAVLVSLRNASKRRRTTNPLNQDGDGDEAEQGDGHLSQREKPSSSTGTPTLSLLDQLVQAQTRRLELLLEEFCEERRQERRQTQELLLLLLSRMDGVPRGDVAALEALVEQQRLHLEQLFELVETEREAEWGRAQDLLREIEADRGGGRR